MAIYRQIYDSFWCDSKISDDFTIDDRYFYLYLLTNPHTTLSGCYSISNSYLVAETGFTLDKIRELIDRLERVHNVIRYSKENKEVLILNWHKYNWSNSEKLLRGVLSESQSIKTVAFKDYVQGLASGDTVSIPDVIEASADENDRYHTNRVSIGYMNQSDTVSEKKDGVAFTPVSVSVSDTVSDTVSVSNMVSEKKDKEKASIKTATKVRKENKVESNLRLLDMYGSDLSEAMISKLSEWVTYKGKKNFMYEEAGMKSLIAITKKNINLHGEGAVLGVIDLSMSNGWTGIIWEKISTVRNQREIGSFMDMLQHYEGDGA